MGQNNDFSYATYRTMLEDFQAEGYRFAAFTEAESLLQQQSRFVLLRHDIDLDLAKALPMARIETDMGVRATWFFRVRSDHHNAFSREGSVVIREILEQGHHFGLHFDCAAYPAETTVDEFARFCRLEAQLLETWFGRAVSVVSFHRPSPLILSGNPALTAPLKHTYMREFIQSILYLSDSRGEFRFGFPTESEAFRRGRPLHVLVHPIWWNERPAAPYPTLRQFIQRRQAAFERSLARNCPSVFPVPKVETEATEDDPSPGDRG